MYFIVMPAISNPFGRLGAWVLRYLPERTLTEVAHAVDETGYDTLWVSGGMDPGVFDVVERLLEETSRVKVAVGVVNIWAETPESVTAAWQRFEESHPGRLYVGLGISHAPLVEGRLTERYSRPLTKTITFFDGLDSQTDPLPKERRFIGALGPKMLTLAAERSLGAHPYLVSVERTTSVRQHISGTLVVPEVGVVLDSDLESARAVARTALEHYLGYPNYLESWRRSGFTEADFANGGSDTLIDSLFALGDIDAIGARVEAYRQAGADHVALQAVDDAVDPVSTFRALANL